MTEIRPAVPDDAAGIAKVHTSSWQRAYRGLVPDHFLDTLKWELREAFWDRELREPSQPGGTVLVATEHGQVSGFIAVGPGRDEDCEGSFEVYALYVDPAWWDKRVGTQLLERGLAAVPAGAQVTLWVLEGNTRGRAFYANQGFVPDGTTKVDEIGGRPLVEVRYARPSEER